MTKEELSDFCVENAGKLATGKHVRTGEVKSGRIIAFKIDQYNRPLILLENIHDVEKKDLPNPLPQVPYLLDNWYRVISPAKMGDMCLAESVVIYEEVSDQPAQTELKFKPVLKALIPQKVQEAIKEEAAKRKCNHDICDPDWCKLKYIGVI